MTSSIPVEMVSFVPASPREDSRGLTGYVVLVLNGRWRIDATVRRTRSGRYALSFPARRDRDGKSHLIAGPIDAATRAEVERLVLQELGFSDKPATSAREGDGDAHA